MPLTIHKTCKQCGNDIELEDADLATVRKLIAEQDEPMDQENRYYLRMVLTVGALIVLVIATIFAGITLEGIYNPSVEQQAVKDPKTTVEIEYEKGFETKRKVTRPGEKAP